MIKFAIEMDNETAISVVNTLHRRGLEMRTSMYADTQLIGGFMIATAVSLEQQRSEHFKRIADGTD